MRRPHQPTTNDERNTAITNPAGLDADDAWRRWGRKIMRSLGLARNGDGSARISLDELIESRDETEKALGDDERVLVTNVLHLRERSVEDVQVPRADIVAVSSDASLSEIVDVMTTSGHSRLPVYRETLDDAMGMVHIKDILAWRGSDASFDLSTMVRPVLFVAPSMEILELLLQMRLDGSHLALVVDEFGGIDGLVTIEDLVEEIVGEFTDEHGRQSEPSVVQRGRGLLDADARAPIEILEEHFGSILEDEERDEIDTVGGLVASLAGRVPIRGELISHPSGVEFQVVDADPRRIKRVRIRGEKVLEKRDEASTSDIATGIQV